MSHAFPRTRDEWLEPSNDNGSQDRFVDYVIENYHNLGEFAGEDVYYSKREKTLVSINFEDFIEDSNGDFGEYSEEIEDSEVFFEMAISNAHKIISEKTKGQK